LETPTGLSIEEIKNLIKTIEDLFLMPGTKPPIPEIFNDLPEFKKIVITIESLQQFIYALSNGDLSHSLQIRGKLAGSLKGLQASLRHLTWQTQMIADGDFSQRVDFMGEFSVAFNQMVISLEESRSALEQSQNQLREEILIRKLAETAEREARLISDHLRIVSSELNRFQDKDQLLNQLLSIVKEVIAYDTAALGKINNEYFEIIHNIGFAERNINLEKVMAGKDCIVENFPVIQDLISFNQPLIISDTHTDIRWRILPGMEDISSWVGIPILIRDKVFGFMTFNKTEVNFYQPYLFEALQILTNQVSMALENATLFNEIQRLATIDPLTQVHNRRFFFEQAIIELERCCRYKRPACIILIDIDFFKSVNDHYGHLAGDLVLKNIAALICNQLRTVDFLGRYGGEEFVVFLPETSETSAFQVAERLRKEIEALVTHYSNNKIQCTVSLGLANFDIKFCNRLEDFLEQADQALYRAKHNGRNQVSL
jgi:diguanylate cyclase (GGDEF)-like protein